MHQHEFLGPTVRVLSVTSLLRKGKEFLRPQSADLGSLGLRGEVEHDLRQPGSLFKVRHAVAQFSPNHPIGAQRLIRPLHNGLSVEMWVSLL